MGTISGTLYQALGIGASGNLARPNATNGITGRIQAVDLGVTTSADFDGATLSFSTGAIDWNALDFTNSDHDDLVAGTGANTHAQIDSHIGSGTIHVDWAAASAGTIHIDNYIEGGPGKDTDAIHVNVAQEISGITEEVSPAGSDLILIESIANGTGKRRVQINNLPGGTDADAIHDNVAQEFSAISNKASPTADDLFLIEDAAASTGKKYVTFANVSHTIIGDIGSTTHANIDVHVTGANPHSGSAASGVNSDITSLTGLTTPLAGDYGGTETAYVKFTGSSATKRTYTLPDADSTVAVSGGAFHDTFSDFAAGEHRVINDSGSGSTELWSAQKITSELASVQSGYSWQDSVLDIANNTAAPPTEVTGDRYLLDDTAGGVHANWDGAGVWDIVEFNGSTWDVVYDHSVIGEGGATWVEDENIAYVDNGTDFVKSISVYAHNDLASLDSGDYQHLTSAEHTEITTFFGSTDITYTEAETLTDGSDAGSLHIHDSDYYTETEMGATGAGVEGMTKIGAGGFTNLTGSDVGAVLDDIDGDWDPTNWDAGYAHGTGSGSDHTDVATNTTHSTGSGSDHADVATNTAHSTGSGSDHADVASNTTHRSSDGSDHTFLDQSVTGGSSPTLDGSNFTGIPVDTGISGTKANFNTACSDGSFAFLDSDNVFTGETTVNTFILSGDGGTPSIKAPEVAFTIVNPGGTGTAGYLATMESSGDVTNRTAGTQNIVGTFVGDAGPGTTAYVTPYGIVHYTLKGGESPVKGVSELFCRNDASYHQMSTGAPTSGLVYKGRHIDTDLMLFFADKYYEFET